jgi:tripartite-type tricarboxylate transporter receptor subunit TctC
MTEGFMNRRVFLASLPLIGVVPVRAFADQWPSRPITFIVPLGAGSTADIFARIVGNAMAEALKAAVIVEDLPSGAGNIGVRMAARAAKDGYTVLIGTNGPLAINVGLFSNLPFDPLKDFTPVLPMVASFNGLIVSKDKPFRSVADLVAYAKARSGQLTYSSGGAGTTHHLSAALFCHMASIDALHVPFRGAMDGINAVLSGQVSFGFFNLPNVVPLAQGGQLRVLAVTGANRSPLMPEAPTMQEAGLEGYETDVWFGVYVPAGVPEPIVSRMRAPLVDLMGRASFKAQMEKLGYELMPVRTEAESNAFLRAEIEKWVGIVKLSGAHAN